MSFWKKIMSLMLAALLCVSMTAAVADVMDEADYLTQQGKAYLYGEGVEQDVHTAHMMLQMAAQMGDPEAMYYLGTLYSEGLGVERDVQQALSWYEQAAEMDFIPSFIEESEEKETDPQTPDAETLYQNAKDAYDAGEYEEALKWFLDAAQLDHPSANHYVGYMHYFGEGVECDYEKAYLYFQKAAELDPESSLYAYNVGLMYEHGYGTEQDTAKALEWYQKSAALGDEDAKAKVEKLTVEQQDSAHPESKVQEYQRLALEGDVDAMFDLGYAYMEGEGVKQDYYMAMAWFLNAAEHGNAAAMCNIGWLYESGYGAAQDYGKALEWYQKSAELGDEVAAGNLGLLYHYGRGTDVDLDKAVEWYRKGVAGDHIRSMRYLGDVYRYGYEEPDYANAMIWYLMAAEREDADAATEIGLLYENGLGVAQSYKKAREWYEKAAALGYGRGFDKLGLLYENGHGVEIDLDKAEEYYRKAVEAGEEEAQERLDRVLGKK